MKTNFEKLNFELILVRPQGRIDPNFIQERVGRTRKQITEKRKMRKVGEKNKGTRKNQISSSSSSGTGSCFFEKVLDL